MSNELALEFKVANLIASGIEIEQAIEAYRCLRANEGAHRCVFLQSTTGANAHELKGAMLVVFEASLEIDVGKSIELVHHDVDIVATDACAQYGDAFALIGTCDGVELTTFNITFFGFEM